MVLLSTFVGVVITCIACRKKINQSAVGPNSDVIIAMTDDKEPSTACDTAVPRPFKHKSKRQQLKDEYDSDYVDGEENHIEMV